MMQADYGQEKQPCLAILREVEEGEEDKRDE